MSRPSSILVPSIERRLSAWLQVADQSAHRSKIETSPTVTISRQFGCEGFPLAERLKDLFKDVTGTPWNIYDKMLLERVAQDEKLSLSLLQNLGDEGAEWDKYAMFYPHFTTHRGAFELLPKYILQIARTGNAIIVGRGGAVITQKLDNCYHFRLEASLQFRVQSMSQRLDMSLDEAEEMVRKNETLRERFVERCLGCSIRDIKYYDAIFNNERHPIEDIAHAVATYVMESWKSRAAHVHQSRGKYVPPRATIADPCRLTGDCEVPG